jgi:hypothetical protein
MIFFKLEMKCTAKDVTPPCYIKTVLSALSWYVKNNWLHSKQGTDEVIETRKELHGPVARSILNSYYPNGGIHPGM